MKERMLKSIKVFVIAIFVLMTSTQISFAQEVLSVPHGTENIESGSTEGKLDIKGEIFGHIRDSYDWHFFNIGEGEHATHVSIPLPVLLFSPTTGFKAFLSSKLQHGHTEYEGYKLNTTTGKIESTDPSNKFYNISLTKNVVSMFLSMIILWFLMTGVAKKYKKNGTGVAPSGFQNALEPIIGFIQDTVAKPSLGKHYMKYMPLLLSMFFFIWINNLLGLIPGGANLTGNIAVTLVLALIFFVVMLFNSNKNFWGHIFNPPGIPLGIKFILVPIEIISNLLIKPAALAIRLFANIFAGHTIITSIILLIFIFSGLSKVAGIVFVPVSVGFSVFMFFLELLVAAIQAFIFTNLTAVFIGQAIEEHHHDDASHAVAHH
jgi:F-type H+-transporting ATPase subunit a